LNSDNSEQKRNKFNPKVYLGKDRIYRPFPGAPRISKVYVWDEKRKEYHSPEFGKSFLTRRYEPDSDGNLKRTIQYFYTLEEARRWQAGLENIPAPVTPASAQEKNESDGPLFREIVEKWKIKKFPTLAASTRIAYEKIIRLYFGSILNLGLYKLTCERVDKWIDELKNPEGKSMKSQRRISFKHELEVLSAVLRFYEDYHSDPRFNLPIKRRHWWDVKTGRKSIPKPKDLSEEEFMQFREGLRKGKHGHILVPLATLQYFEALRISEAAGVYFEDVKLNRLHPDKSRIFIQRSVHYPRVKGLETYVKIGFKNSNQFPDGIKELPVFPKTFEALAPLVVGNQKGLIFQINGKPVGYRTIQYFYDKAFLAAGLPYTATHVLRHGWTREVFNRNPELDIAKQLLGDTSDEAARVYAKRRAGAITNVSQKMWSEHRKDPDPEPEMSKGAGGDRNWSQKGDEKIKPVRFLRVVK
jgi:integrase